MLIPEEEEESRGAGGHLVRQPPETGSVRKVRGAAGGAFVPNVAYGGGGAFVPDVAYGGGGHLSQMLCGAGTGPLKKGRCSVQAERAGGFIARVSFAC